MWLAATMIGYRRGIANEFSVECFGVESTAQYRRKYNECIEKRRGQDALAPSNPLGVHRLWHCFRQY